jgi:hypothetical protein
VDSVEDKKHIMLLYDNDKYKIEVQNRFIINGLKKGEHCVCFTTGDPKQFENEFSASGMDLESFVKQGLVHIHKIEDVSDKELGHSLQEILKQITVDVKPYFRCVGRFVGNISNEKGIKTQIEIEKIIQSIFDSLECSYVSAYSINEIESEKRSQWIKELTKHTDYVIYATNPQRAVAFDTDLLTTTED